MSLGRGFARRSAWRCCCPSDGQVHFRAEILCGTDGAYVSEDRVPARSFSFLDGAACGPRAGVAGSATFETVWWRHGPFTSRILEHAPTAAATDQDRPICRRPHHLALGQRESREGPEALPHRSFERVTELVPGRPSLDLDQALALHPKGIDPLRLPSAAGPTPNNTTATMAPRRSSSSHTAGRHTSSRHAGRRRAMCTRGAGRPLGSNNGRRSAPCRLGTDARASRGRHAVARRERCGRHRPAAHATSGCIERRAPRHSQGTTAPARRSGRSQRAPPLWPGRAPVGAV